MIQRGLMRQVDRLRELISPVVNDDTDLEKIKVLHTAAIPSVKKAIMELESTLQRYSQACDASGL